MRKVNLQKGTIENFNQQFPRILEKSKDFTIIVSGMSRKVVLKNGSVLRYFGTQKQDCKIDGAFIVMMVKREIDAYIETNGIPEFEVVRDVQNFNLKKIEQVVGKKVPLMGIDINACYWNVAHKLGYISDELYERGINKVSKAGLLIAIGCLAKRPLHRVYKNGKLESSHFDDLTYLRYAPFYWNIIRYTYELMIESFKVIGTDSWYMFLTDCVFVDVGKMKVAQKFLADYGFKYKNHLIEYTAFDGRRLNWFDFKHNEDKQMYVFGRDINDTIALENINGAMRSPLHLLKTKIKENKTK
jgi:hypothetical protein